MRMEKGQTCIQKSPQSYSAQYASSTPLRSSPQPHQCKREAILVFLALTLELLNKVITISYQNPPSSECSPPILHWWWIKTRQRYNSHGRISTPSRLQTSPSCPDCEQLQQQVRYTQLMQTGITPASLVACFWCNSLKQAGTVITAFDPVPICLFCLVT